MSEPEGKTCTKCGEFKPLSEFYRQKGGKHGVTSRCRSCMVEAGRKWKKSNRKRVNENARKWREANPEKVKKSKMKYNEANRENAREYSRNYREANHEKIREESRKRYDANPEKAREYSRRWREANPEKARKIRRDSMKRWWESNLKKARERSREVGREGRRCLNDTYIKKLVTRDSPLTAADIPQELVDLKRAQLQIARKLKEEATS